MGVGFPALLGAHIVDAQSVAMGTTGEHAAIIYAAKATVFLLAIKFNCRFLTRADPPDTLARCHVSPIETGASPQKLSCTFNSLRFFFPIEFLHCKLYQTHNADKHNKAYQNEVYPCIAVIE